MGAAETNTTATTHEHEHDPAGIDDLTGVWNQAGFIAAATPMLASSQRRSMSVTLAYFDFRLDHEATPSVVASDDDAVELALIACANELRRAYRASDIIGRVGSQRLALLLTDQTGVPVPSIEGVRTVTAATADTHELTLTVGTAHGFHGATLYDLMDNADERIKQLHAANDTATRYDNDADTCVPAKPSRLRGKKRR